MQELLATLESGATQVSESRTERLVAAFLAFRLTRKAFRGQDGRREARQEALLSGRSVGC